MIDTGETARVSEPGYFPRWNPYFRGAVRFTVRPDQEVGPQLEGLGLSPPTVRWVVLTHLHTDHAGGLAHFPNAEILVHASEYEARPGRDGARLNGYLPHRWPEWFSPAARGLRPDEPFGPFPASMALTSAGDVRLLPTPGHTPGHMSVVLRERRGQADLLRRGHVLHAGPDAARGRGRRVARPGGGRHDAGADPRSWRPTEDWSTSRRTTWSPPAGWPLALDRAALTGSVSRGAHVRLADGRRGLHRLPGEVVGRVGRPVVVGRELGLVDPAEHATPGSRPAGGSGRPRPPRSSGRAAAPRRRASPARASASRASSG